MSRSFRRPYCTWTGVTFKPTDKIMAARAARRLRHHRLRTTWDFEDYLDPHRYEASHNDVWGWSQDGKKGLASEFRHPDRDRFFDLWWLERWPEDAAKRARQNAVGLRKLTRK